MFVVPSWQELTIESHVDQAESDSGALDLFWFSDGPIIEAIGAHDLHRSGES